ncbi:MAG: winged helix-turn-helix domain-containing protein [Candidatus Levybacteria bacterium]|nr:winged helix-turn-helix domain-containing protein [Candidatus Levybacteria bacterium]
MQLTPLKYFDSLYPAATRKKEIQQFIPYLEKGLSSQLVGLPGSGKSNIFRLLSYNKDARFENFGEYEKYLHFVYIDCSEIKGRPLADITKFILISLAFSLGERRFAEESKEINQYLKEGLEVPDEMILFQSLKKSLDYLSIEKKLTIHLLFDKFDILIPTITSQFFTNLRVLRNHAKYRFGSIFSLTRPLEETIDPLLLADYHDLVAENVIYTTLFDEVGMNFRLSYIEKAARKSLDEKVKQEIIKLSGGHAKIAKLSYEAIISEENRIENIEEYLLKRPTIQGALYEIWNALLPSEQIALKKNISYDDISDLHPYLTASGLFGKDGITIPLFANYITTVPVESIEKITYDEERNEVLVGGSPITDRLSPSEFRLLRFLIQNKERLTSKDEIIQSIWGDQKSQEGVTDQALDQIFYRLRKKIEQDPANPRYIHTIKGKGYKLSD